MKFSLILFLFSLVLLGASSHVTISIFAEENNTPSSFHTFLSTTESEKVNNFLAQEKNTIVGNFKQITSLKITYQTGFVLADIGTKETDVTDVQWLNDATGEINNSVNNILTSQLNVIAPSLQYKLFINGLPYESFFKNENNANNKQAELAFTPQTNNLSVVLSPGHGWYYNTWFNNWRLQRPWINGIVEDYINSDLISELKTKLEPNFSPINSTRELDKNAGNSPETGFPLWQMGAYKNLEYKGLPASVWNDDGGSRTEETNYAKDIRSRGLYANYIQADAMISIHNNAGGGCGTETLYDTSNGWGNRSFTLANSIQYKIIDALRAGWNANWCNRGTKGFNGNYGENRIFKGPAALVEIAFMDRISENNALQSPVFRSIVTDAIRDGLLEYYKTPIATITYPEDNTQLLIQQPITITANAVDTDGTVSYIDFYQGSTFISRDTDGANSWSAEYTPTQYGAYALWAIAHDNDGKRSSSLVNYAFVTEPAVENTGELKTIVTDNDIISAAGFFWQVTRNSNNTVSVRFSSDRINWSNWLPSNSAYTYRPLLYASRDGRLMLVTRSIDGKTEARFTTNGVNWEWFDNLTPAGFLNTPNYVINKLIP